MGRAGQGAVSTPGVAASAGCLQIHAHRRTGTQAHRYGRVRGRVRVRFVQGFRGSGVEVYELRSTS